jgi:hypothetical protein
LSADGAAAAWSIAAGTALTPPAEEEYDLHSAAFGGAALDGVAGVSLRIQHQVQPQRIVGGLYPSLLACAPATGPIAIEASATSMDASALRSWGQHFKGDAAADLVLTFRKFAAAGARVASGAGSTVTVTLRAVAEAQGLTNDGRLQVAFHGISSAGASPLSWAVAA